MVGFYYFWWCVLDHCDGPRVCGFGCHALLFLCILWLYRLILLVFFLINSLWIIFMLVLLAGRNFLHPMQNWSVLWGVWTLKHEWWLIRWLSYSLTCLLFIGWNLGWCFLFVFWAIQLAGGMSSQILCSKILYFFQCFIMLDDDSECSWTFLCIFYLGGGVREGLHINVIKCQLSLYQSNRMKTWGTLITCWLGILESVKQVNLWSQN